MIQRDSQCLKLTPGIFTFYTSSLSLFLSLSLFNHSQKASCLGRRHNRVFCVGGGALSCRLKGGSDAHARHINGGGEDEKREHRREQRRARGVALPVVRLWLQVVVFCEGTLMFEELKFNQPEKYAVTHTHTHTHTHTVNPTHSSIIQPEETKQYLYTGGLVSPVVIVI